MTAQPAKRQSKKTVYKIDRQLRELFDNSDDFKICMLDHDGRIVAWNTSAEKMTGYKATEVMGKNYSIFLSKEDTRRKALKKALVVALKKGSFTAEGIRLRKDGSHFWARTTITPVKEGTKGARFFVIITRNISPERALNLKKEEYIGIASHELRNPIQTLSIVFGTFGAEDVIDQQQEGSRHVA